TSDGLTTLELDGSYTAGSANLKASNVVFDPGSLLSTRKLPSGADPDLGGSVGDSGAILVSAKTITVGTGARLLAHVENGSTFQPGYARLTALGYSAVRTDATPAPAATISLDHATVKGGAITLQANSQERFGVFGFKKNADSEVTVTDS